MKLFRFSVCAALAGAAAALQAVAGVSAVAEHNANQRADAAFHFNTNRPPLRGDAASAATFTLVDGTRDGNGGDLAVLHDGLAPTEEDQPERNFFFAAGTDGGVVLVDLGKQIEVQQVNTFSWHPGARGPQVYTLFASDGAGAGFQAQPKRGTDPAGCGWTRIADVDTRPKSGPDGGQFGVSVASTDGALGKFRYLLFDIHSTEKDDAFGNTFYSEIDVLDRNSPVTEAPPEPVVGKQIVEFGGGRYQCSIDTSETPDLTEVVNQRLVPVVKEWYPKLVEMLPSPGFTAPTNFSIVFKKDMAGVADTSGTRIRVAYKWFRGNLQGESVGSVVHEMVHVVQQYGWARRDRPRSARAPGWLTEGLTDYIRWYCYEPQSHGAEISKQGLARARYDGSYRPTANFLNWISEKYDKDFVFKLNTAIRVGDYSEEFWVKSTGKSLPDLGEAWKQNLAQKLGVELPPPAGSEAKPKP